MRRRYNHSCDWLWRAQDSPAAAAPGPAAAGSSERKPAPKTVHNLRTEPPPCVCGAARRAHYLEWCRM